MRMDYLSSSLDLKGEILDTKLRNLLQKGFGLFGILVDPCFGFLEQFGPAPLNHVAEQGPRRPAEAKQRDPTLELLPRQGDGLVDVIKLFRHIDGTLHHLGVLSVVRAAQGVREVRTLLVDHLHNHAHGLGDDKNVGEYDGSIDEAGIALDGLQRQGGCDLWVSAALEEVAGSLGLMVLGQVAASCAECQPRMLNNASWQPKW